MTIDQAFQTYEVSNFTSKSEKTWKNYRVAKKSLVRPLGDIPMEFIGIQQIEVWKQYMREECMTQTTQRGYMMSFQAVIKYYRKQGFKFIDPRDIELPTNDTPPRTFIRPDQVAALIAAAKNPRDKAIIACIFLGGTRISELLDLDREALNSPIRENGSQVLTVCGKRKKYRPIILNKEARHYLYAYLESRNDSFKPMFISGQNRRITVSRVEQIVHQCTRDAGLEEHVTPHTLRHSYATDMLINGASIYQVSKSMGHESITTTSNIYGHYDTRAMEENQQTFQSSIL